MYFKIADRFNIIDKPNERSSHSAIVLRGGGVIFLLSVWVWEAFVAMGLLELGMSFAYPWFLAGLTIAAGMSFVDDIRSLPDSVRLVGQFAAMGLTLYQFYCVDGNFLVGAPWWMLVGFIILGLIIFVGASNIINFMDGINGITGGYALAVVLPFQLNPLRVFSSDATRQRESELSLCSRCSLGSVLVVRRSALLEMWAV